MNTKIGSIPFLFALVLVLSTFGITASTALAQKPVKSELTIYPAAVLDGICNFPVAQNGTMNLTETDFYDQSGSLIRMDFHVVEQDTFHMVIDYNPDGTPIFGEKQLVGIPFAFSARWLFESSGNLTHLYCDGVTEKIWLPDGSLFISAGRLDFVAHGMPGAVLSPDHGNPGNIAGFCAALAP